MQKLSPTQIFKPLTYGLLGLALLVALYFLAMGANNSDGSLSPMETLKQLDGEQDHAKIIELLYTNVDPEFAAQALPWLKERDYTGYAPYYYAQARYLLILNQPYQALQYYMLAGLSARIDAARCADISVAALIAFLEKGFEGVHEYMQLEIDSKATSGNWALHKEEQVAQRAIPAWICSQGTSPRSYVNYIPDEIWQHKRSDIRDEFARYIASPTSLATDTAAGASAATEATP